MNYNDSTFDFRQNAIKALQDKALRAAMRKATDIFIKMRVDGVTDIPVDDLKEKASAIRTQVLNNLPVYLDEFSANATRAGAIVYRAKDAQSARETVFQI